ncbi:hypothetical protein GALL_101950 [mine drainage metagenome]|uniref:Uncharacterized protein n=1 Tax=mine drainage metagenome TaxID=410659 RepID=A0A1J5T5X6_9ZZZZ
MKEQNFKNHPRFVPLYHYVASLLILAILIGSIVNLVHSTEETIYSASLITALTVVAALNWAFLRIFALKAQDRAIRAEENFRHFILTGKPHDSRLRMSQIIALRFASDEEFVALSQRAVAENLSNTAIKKEVKNWRADYHRA